LNLPRYFSPPPGIIPHDGRNISFREISTQLYTTFNFSPSFSLYTARYIAKILNRPYKTGRFDLSDINVHNGIEHDASLVRKCQTTISPLEWALSGSITHPLGTNLISVDKGVMYMNNPTRACQTPHW
jgi:hypothetical protein